MGHDTTDGMPVPGAAADSVDGGASAEVTQSQGAATRASVRGSGATEEEEYIVGEARPMAGPWRFIANSDIITVADIPEDFLYDVGGLDEEDDLFNGFPNKRANIDDPIFSGFVCSQSYMQASTGLVGSAELGRAWRALTCVVPWLSPLRMPAGAAARLRVLEMALRSLSVQTADDLDCWRDDWTRVPVVDVRGGAGLDAAIVVQMKGFAKEFYDTGEEAAERLGADYAHMTLGDKWRRAAERTLAAAKSQAATYDTLVHAKCMRSWRHETGKAAINEDSVVVFARGVHGAELRGVVDLSAALVTAVASEADEDELRAAVAAWRGTAATGGEGAVEAFDTVVAHTDRGEIAYMETVAQVIAWMAGDPPAGKPWRTRADQIAWINMPGSVAALTGLVTGAIRAWVGRERAQAEAARGSGARGGKCGGRGGTQGGAGRTRDIGTSRMRHIGTSRPGGARRGRHTVVRRPGRERDTSEPRESVAGWLGIGTS